MSARPSGRQESPASSLLPSERAKAFIDAVVAIAMTLLILPLMESAAELGELETSEWFSEHAGQLRAFLISFALIAAFWIGHHRVFAQVLHVTPRFLSLNIAWLLTVVWLPVVTAMTGAARTIDPVILLTYIGSMAITSFVWLCIRLYLARHPSVHTASSDAARDGVADAIALLALYLLATVLAISIPWLNYFALLILFLAHPLQLLCRRLLRRWTPGEGTADEHDDAAAGRNATASRDVP